MPATSLQLPTHSTITSSNRCNAARFIGFPITLSIPSGAMNEFDELVWSKLSLINTILAWRVTRFLDSHCRNSSINEANESSTNTIFQHIVTTAITTGVAVIITVTGQVGANKNNHLLSDNASIRWVRRPIGPLDCTRDHRWRWHHPSSTYAFL